MNESTGTEYHNTTRAGLQEAQIAPVKNQPDFRRYEALKSRLSPWLNYQEYSAECQRIARECNV